jgi:AGCS family alanine or glycine:cation symporter
VAGLRRASFSNEAGIGSSPIAHAAVKTEIPVTEGLVGLLEPFIDTVIVCTMTALIVVISGVYTQQAHDGVALTSVSFASVLPWFPYVLSVAVILFAFATMISWSYYGLRSWNYIFGRSKISSAIYNSIFCLFTVAGASMNLKSVVDFSDAMIFAMGIPNIIGLYFLAPEVKKDLAAYRKLKNI